MTTAPGRPTRPPESVWDYPRPPRAEPDDRRAVLRHGGVVVADTTDLVRILETSHPPTFYLPRTAFGAYLHPARRTTFCEWKGTARYVDIVVPGVAPLRDVGWWYPEPDRRYPQLRRPGGRLRRTVRRDHPRRRAGRAATRRVLRRVDHGEIVGPVKGGPGTWGW